MKNITKMAMTAFAVATTATLSATPPDVSNVNMVQPSGGRTVTITYTLSDAPAVVTLDVQTNANTSAAADDPGWTSIGGEAIWNAMGDVWKRVETGSRTINWRPDHSWPDHIVPDGGARAVVTAWALDNTPDYMVVDLAAANTVRYYPGVDFLPGSAIGQKGAVTNNIAYKTTKLVMRKIMARGVEWTMGSADGETQRTAENETAHNVTLTNNYYIGIFEMTQAQWKNIAPDASAVANFTVDGDMRPMEKVSYVEIRKNDVSTYAQGNVANNTYRWPADPNPASFLGKLRNKTGLDFDLPSEAQWEFAARAGHGSGYWSDGSRVLNLDSDENLDNLGRYKGDNPAGNSTTASLSPAAGGTDVVGSYKANDWGLYDMHGNVREWCLDFYAADISSIHGLLNIDPANSGSGLATGSSTMGVYRGGSFYDDAKICRAASRVDYAQGFRISLIGLRVVCTAGLQ